MAKLGVSATIHHGDLSLILVAVENDAGDPLPGLGKESFHVYLWASRTGGPAAGPSGNFPALVLIESVRQLPFFDAGHFYELRLGNAAGSEDGIDWEAPVRDFGPIVYAVLVRTRSDRGQAIACACHPYDPHIDFPPGVRVYKRR
jgi:hypothetical protein